MQSQTFILNTEDFVKLNFERFLIAKNYFKKEDEYEHIQRNVSSIAQKFRNIESYINFMTIKIFVKNKDVNISDLSSNNVIFIEDIEKILLLKAIYLNPLQKGILRNKKISVTLTEFSEKFDQDYYIFDYLLKFSKYLKDGQIDLSYIKTAKKNHYYVKGAKKSLFATIFSFTENKRTREKRVEINCSCGTRYILKERNLKDCFYKTGDKLFYRCNKEIQDSHPLEFESKDFVFSLKEKNEKESNCNTLLIIPKYFKGKLENKDYIKWISENIRGQI